MSEVVEAARKGKRAKPEPDFLTGSQLARKLGLARAETVNAWVAKGAFPPPWAYTDPCRAVWRADHYAVFKTTGEWPKEAWKRLG